MATPFLFDGPEGAPLTLVLAHGAGAAMDTPFMNTFAGGIAAAAGIRVARFEFPYMRARRETGARKAPDREPVLLDAWRAAVAELGGGTNVAIGGKSLGGRMASRVADELGVRGLVCLGFPFHAPGRDPGTRIAHLPLLRTPTLILQGTRDPFGTKEDVAGYDLSPAIRIHWLEDGDHDLSPRSGSGRTRRQNWDEAIAAAAEFLAGRFG